MDHCHLVRRHFLVTTNPAPAARLHFDPGPNPDLGPSQMNNYTLVCMLLHLITALWLSRLLHFFRSCSCHLSKPQTPLSGGHCSDPN